jgi:hypothetical protein
VSQHSRYVTVAMQSPVHQPTAYLGRQRRNWLRRLVIGSVLVFALALAAVGALVPFLTQAQPRGLIRSVPLPARLDPTRQDRLAYLFHAGLGTIFNELGAPPMAAASEWFKAAWHARSDAELESVGSGIATAERRTTVDALEASLCSFVSGWSPESGWEVGARGRQFVVLMRANLSCGDPSMVFGMVPDDVPITYTANPPDEGLYHETYYPRYGLTQQGLSPAIWVHNLAHGEIVLLYNCPAGCPDVVAQAQELQANLRPSRDAHGPGARVIITSYEQMDYPLAVLAWGALLPLGHFDREQIEQFYEDHVDRGVECVSLHCPD